MKVKQYLPLNECHKTIINLEADQVMFLLLITDCIKHGRSLRDLEFL